MFRLPLALRQGSLALVTVAAVGCAVEPSNTSEGSLLGMVEQGLTTYGDWAGYGDGQCVIGAQAFYKKRFGVALKATGVETKDVGSCTYLGACMYWVSTKAKPDPAVWNRYEWGSEMPKLYDLVIYPPTGASGYGHVASVDHMEGTDPAAYNKLYVMDSNWTLSEKKSPAIHTTGRKPYGFYRLKSLEGAWCSPGHEGALNCGDQAGLHDADKASLYRCEGLNAKLVKKCETSCVKSPAGVDDKCADPPVVVKDAGPEVKPAEDSALDTLDETAVTDAGGDGDRDVASESDTAGDGAFADSALTERGEGVGSEAASAGCSVPSGGFASRAALGYTLAIGLFVGARRRSRGRARG